MSTRSVVLVYSEFDEYDWEKKEHRKVLEPIARWYRHCDGYPEANGFDICKSLAEADMLDKVNNRNWAQHFLKRYMALGIDVELEPPAGEGQWCHDDLEYVYRVTGHQDYTGGGEDSPGEMEKVRIEVFAVNWHVDLMDDYSGLDESKRLFVGSWKQFPAWLRRWCAEAYGQEETVLDADYDPMRWCCDGVSEETWNSLRVLSHERGA